MLLNKINSSLDVKKLSGDETVTLCNELREFLIKNISLTGGHFASNMGVVELTVALHRVFDTKTDRIIFDVGHQNYIHKILTGRREQFGSLRKFGGLSGFPKPSEAIDDAFITGHASTSISAALGMARARTLKQEDYSIIALIGDGALTGGLAYEALNDAGQSGEQIIIILNDNGMSITQNVGGLSKHLANQRLKPRYFRFKKAYRKFMASLPGGDKAYKAIHKIKTVIKDSLLPCSMFEEMGFTYLGPIDGHNIEDMENLLKKSKDFKKPILIHAVTVKGKGYEFSEKNPEDYHGVSSFDIKDGKETNNKTISFSDIFGEEIVLAAKDNKNICAITAAMKTNIGLDDFSVRYPSRFFDVGIAEEHAVTMSAGMAKQGLVPIVAIYSTFLQRAYDMLIHDVAIQKLHVVFAIDRAGLTGEDGETHHGVFDVSFLCQIPHIKVFCPSNFVELKTMLNKAIYEFDCPVAVRYPKGGEGLFIENTSENDAYLIKKGGKDITFVSYGIMINNVLEAIQLLEQKNISAELVKLNSINPIDYNTIFESAKKTKSLIIVEDCIKTGSVGERIAAYAGLNGIKLDNIILKNIGDGFITHGSIPQLQKLCGIDAESIYETAFGILNKK